MSKIIAIMNQKGGVGKTTLSIHLATSISKSKPTLLLDLDPQGSSTTWWETRKCSIGEEGLSCLHVNKPDKTSIYLIIEKAKAAGHTVIIDCPPAMVDSTFIAISKADIVLIPVTPSPLDIWATERAINTIESSKKVNPNIKTVLVPNRFQKNNLSKHLPPFLAKFNVNVSDPIGLRTAITQTLLDGVTVFDKCKCKKSKDEINNLKHYLELI